jgi:phenylalanyl-tRNA synthetase beta chain
MKISLNWVKQFTDIDVTTDELVKLATERLGGIEGVTDLAKQYDGIVVVRVVSCEKHPNADKLSLCKVDDGGAVKDVERDENGFVQVVCGAPNVREGLLVAWIPPRAIVPASYGEKELFVLEARDLRGQLSNGMLASPRELGINDDHEGILEIEEDVQPGTPFKNLYDLDDTILEIENKMFTHRPDGFGHLGVAREIAGIQHKAFTSPSWYQKMENGKWKMENGGNNNLSVDNQIPDLCPRYMAVVLENVKIAPSPLWLQSCLRRVGIRPINNVVDITNYMMALTAQPLHAFDFDKVAKNSKAEIVIRKPRDGEKMILLDGKEITPHKDAVLICNTDGPIALGGIMGGGNSEVDENTTRVVLECATFDMYNIRKTSMIHGIFTNAVTRFTKGQPKAQLAPVINKTIDMLEELVGAKQAGSVIDIADETNDIRHKTGGFIEIEAKFINDRLGSKFTREEIVALLNNVEIKAHIASGPIEVRTPFWRTDLEIKEDIVEEIGRLYGFNQLPIELPKQSIKPVSPDQKRALKSRIRYILSRAGANEVLAYSFVHGNLLKKAGQKTENSYALRNALSPDLQYYRQTLTPSLIDLVSSNIRSGFDEFALFEINKSHNKIHDNDDNLPGELNMVALTFASKNSKQASYFNVRRYLDYLASSFGFTLRYDAIAKDVNFPVTAPFEQSRSASVTVNETDTFLGIVGEYRNEVIKNFKLPIASAGFELGLDHLLEAVNKSPVASYQPLSKYPSTEQDLTLKVSDDVVFADLEEVLRTELANAQYDWHLAPLSIFKKENEKTKNISFKLTFTHHKRTLTTAEVTKLVESLSWRAHEELGAEKI